MKVNLEFSELQIRQSKQGKQYITAVVLNPTATQLAEARKIVALNSYAKNLAELRAAGVDPNDADAVAEAIAHQ